MTEDATGPTGNEPQSNLVEQLAHSVGASARAEAVFGRPVERDGITVVPVARVRWGVGGGYGKKPKSPDTGGGGGGGMVLSPAGYIEIRQGETRFRPIVDPALVFATAAGLGVMAFLVVRRLTR
jgi:uncharacterized spore protein YtfJ